MFSPSSRLLEVIKLKAVRHSNFNIQIISFLISLLAINLLFIHMFL